MATPDDEQGRSAPPSGYSHGHGAQSRVTSQERAYFGRVKDAGRGALPRPLARALAAASPARSAVDDPSTEDDAHSAFAGGAHTGGASTERAAPAKAGRTHDSSEYLARLGRDEAIRAWEIGNVPGLSAPRSAGKAGTRHTGGAPAGATAHRARPRHTLRGSRSGPALPPSGPEPAASSDSSAVRGARQTSPGPVPHLGTAADAPAQGLAAPSERSPDDRSSAPGSRPAPPLLPLSLFASGGAAAAGTAASGTEADAEPSDAAPCPVSTAAQETIARTLLREWDRPALRVPAVGEVGSSRWAPGDGRLTWEPCRVLEWDEVAQEGSVEWLVPGTPDGWRGTGRRKRVARLNLLLAGDDEGDLAERRHRAHTARALVETYTRAVARSQYLGAEAGAPVFGIPAHGGPDDDAVDDEPVEDTVLHELVGPIKKGACARRALDDLLPVPLSPRGAPAGGVPSSAAPLSIPASFVARLLVGAARAADNHLIELSREVRHHFSDVFRRMRAEGHALDRLRALAPSLPWQWEQRASQQLEAMDGVPRCPDLRLGSTEPGRGGDAPVSVLVFAAPRAAPRRLPLRAYAVCARGGAAGPLCIVGGGLAEQRGGMAVDALQRGDDAPVPLIELPRDPSVEDESSPVACTTLPRSTRHMLPAQATSASLVDARALGAGPGAGSVCLGARLAAMRDSASRPAAERLVAACGDPQPRGGVQAEGTVLVVARPLRREALGGVRSRLESHLWLRDPWLRQTISLCFTETRWLAHMSMLFGEYAFLRPQRLIGLVRGTIAPRLPVEKDVVHDLGLRAYQRSDRDLFRELGVEIPRPRRKRGVWDLERFVDQQDALLGESRRLLQHQASDKLAAMVTDAFSSLCQRHEAQGRRRLEEALRKLQRRWLWLWRRAQVLGTEEDLVDRLVRLLPSDFLLVRETWRKEGTEKLPSRYQLEREARETEEAWRGRALDGAWHQGHGADEAEPLRDWTFSTAQTLADKARDRPVSGIAPHHRRPPQAKAASPEGNAAQPAAESDADAVTGAGAGDGAMGRRPAAGTAASRLLRGRGADPRGTNPQAREPPGRGSETEPESEGNSFVPVAEAEAMMEEELRAAMAELAGQELAHASPLSPRSAAAGRARRRKRLLAHEKLLLGIDPNASSDEEEAEADADAAEEVGGRRRGEFAADSRRRPVARGPRRRKAAEEPVREVATPRILRPRSAGPVRRAGALRPLGGGHGRTGASGLDGGTGARGAGERGEVGTQYSVRRKHGGSAGSKATGAQGQPTPDQNSKGDSESSSSAADRLEEGLAPGVTDTLPAAEGASERRRRRRRGGLRFPTMDDFAVSSEPVKPAFHRLLAVANRMRWVALRETALRSVEEYMALFGGYGGDHVAGAVHQLMKPWETEAVMGSTAGGRAGSEAGGPPQARGLRKKESFIVRTERAQAWEGPSVIDSASSALAWLVEGVAWTAVDLDAWARWDGTERRQVQRLLRERSARSAAKGRARGKAGQSSRAGEQRRGGSPAHRGRGRPLLRGRVLPPLQTEAEAGSRDTAVDGSSGGGDGASDSGEGGEAREMQYLAFLGPPSLPSEALDGEAPSPVSLDELDAQFLGGEAEAGDGTRALTADQGGAGTAPWDDSSGAGAVEDEGSPTSAGEAAPHSPLVRLPSLVIEEEEEEDDEDVTEGDDETQLGGSGDAQDRVARGAQDTRRRQRWGADGSTPAAEAPSGMTGAGTAASPAGKSASSASSNEGVAEAGEQDLDLLDQAPEEGAESSARQATDPPRSDSQPASSLPPTALAGLADTAARSPQAGSGSGSGSGAAGYPSSRHPLLRRSSGRLQLEDWKAGITQLLRVCRQRVSHILDSREALQAHTKPVRPPLFRVRMVVATEGAVREQMDASAEELLRATRLCRGAESPIAPDADAVSSPTAAQSGPRPAMRRSSSLFRISVAALGASPAPAQSRNPDAGTAAAVRTPASGRQTPTRGRLRKAPSFMQRFSKEAGIGEDLDTAGAQQRPAAASTAQWGADSGVANMLGQRTVAFDPPLHRVEEASIGVVAEMLRGLQDLPPISVEMLEPVPLARMAEPPVGPRDAEVRSCRDHIRAACRSSSLHAHALLGMLRQFEFALRVAPSEHLRQLRKEVPSEEQDAEAWRQAHAREVRYFRSCASTLRRRFPDRLPLGIFMVEMGSVRDLLAARCARLASYIVKQLDQETVALSSDILDAYGGFVAKMESEPEVRVHAAAGRWVALCARTCVAVPGPERVTPTSPCSQWPSSESSSARSSCPRTSSGTWRRV